MLPPPLILSLVARSSPCSILPPTSGMPDAMLPAPGGSGTGSGAGTFVTLENQHRGMFDLGYWRCVDTVAWQMLTRGK